MIESQMSKEQENKENEIMAKQLYSIRARFYDKYKIRCDCDYMIEDLIFNKIIELETLIQGAMDNKFTYCAYCGKEFNIEKNGATEEVSRHIHECKKHPIADYKEVLRKIARCKKIDFEYIQELVSKCLKLTT